MHRDWTKRRTQVDTDLFERVVRKRGLERHGPRVDVELIAPVEQKRCCLPTRRLAPIRVRTSIAVIGRTKSEVYWRSGPPLIGPPRAEVDPLQQFNVLRSGHSRHRSDCAVL